LLSSLVGVNAVQGILAPQGRGQPGEQETIERKLGWSLQDIESNPSKRATLPSEAQLNRQALGAALQFWRSAGWHAVSVIFEKVGYFWLSTDQLTSTRSFSAWQRVLRWSGVVFYWFVLLLGVRGWFILRRANAPLAITLLIYAGVAPVSLFPFPMITRFRVPLVDPLLCILSGSATLVSLGVETEARVVPSFIRHLVAVNSKPLHCP